MVMRITMNWKQIEILVLEGLIISCNVQSQDEIIALDWLLSSRPLVDELMPKNTFNSANKCNF